MNLKLINYLDELLPGESAEVDEDTLGLDNDLALNILFKLTKFMNVKVIAIRGEHNILDFEIVNKDDVISTNI